MDEEERQTITQYRQWMTKGDFNSRHFRFVLSTSGLPLIHTPLPLLRRLLRIRPEDRVLDVGCGRASVLRYLYRTVPLQHPPVGVDATRPLLHLGHGHQRPVHLVEGSVTHLPFQDSTFTVAICSYVIKHFGNQSAVRLLQEVHRVLRPDGRLVLWEFAPARLRPLTKVYLKVLSLEVSSEHLRSSAEVANLLKEAGFAHVAPAAPTPFLYPPIARVVLVGQKNGIYPAS
ncbi:MAG: class I SAM-dependent methyltransferase [Chloroflexi bacterium]|nr:class I SAM-dependent methyltransferase [Chloroflexota bacterium]